MNQRQEFARICQEGASNRRRVSRALLEAIEECQAEGADPDKDPAVFLILHQLAFLLTGHDMAVGDPRLSRRWDDSTRAVEVDA